MKGQLCYNCGSGRFIKRKNNKSLFPKDDGYINIDHINFVYIYPIKYCPACGEIFIGPMKEILGER